MRRLIPLAVIGALLALPAVPAAADSALSRGKPATASSVEAAEYGAAKAFDGDPATRWAGVEGHDPEWISVDLGAPAAITKVTLKWEAAYAKAYRIELSDDARNWRSAYSTTSGNGATDDLTLTGTARYVRLYGTQRATAWGYSLYSFDVYGTGTTPEWKLTWQDEFDQAQGTRPSSSKWVYDLGGEPTWGNEEWQYYTNRAQNVSTDGQGNLAITARREKLPGMENCQYGTCDITSGRITTKDRFAQAYGRFEARIKVPAGQGLWPAFWMMGNDIDTVDWPNNGEIDIMEIIGNEPSTLYGTAHGPAYFGEKGLSDSVNLPAGAKFANAFHVFSVEWSPDLIVWKLDGTPYHTVTKSSIPAGKKWVFDHPFYLLLNLAVGGVWPGPPDATTKFPATLLVDYVRVYTKA